MKSNNIPVKADKQRCVCTTQSVHVPKRWARHYQALQALRDQVMEDRSRHFADVAEPLERQHTEMADTATDAFDHDLALCLLTQKQRFIREIDAAQQRILDGTYGICEETGDPIPAERLHALPWTRWTAQAASDLEQHGMTDRMQLGRIASVTGGTPLSGYFPETEEMNPGDVSQDILNDAPVAVIE